MTEQPPTGHNLTAPQQTRVEFARRDYEQARSEDLAQLEAANLIILVERLRNRLGDVLAVVDEVTPSPPS